MTTVNKLFVLRSNSIPVLCKRLVSLGRKRVSEYYKQEEASLEGGEELFNSYVEHSKHILETITLLDYAKKYVLELDI